MILIADSGSTKTTWCLFFFVGFFFFFFLLGFFFFFDTEGYNPYFVTKEYIVHSLTANLPSTINTSLIREIWFYGAGCFEDKTSIVSNALTKIFVNADLYVGLDLLGSARSVLCNQPGFVAILGAGAGGGGGGGDKE